MWKIIILRMLANILNMLETFLMALPGTVVIGIVIFYVLKRIEQKKSISPNKKSAVILFGMYIAVMLQMAILFRDWGSILEVDLIPFDRYGGFRYIVLYGVANAFVFLPVGILLPIIWKKMNNMKMILLAGFGGSLFIELSQLILQCGVCQTEDLIMNTVGAGVGYWIFRKYNNKKKL